MLNNKILQKWGIFLLYQLLTPKVYSGIFTVEVVMKNKYGKQCCYCACYVEAGEGRCWRWDETNRWYVACEDCFQEKKEERRKK